MRPTVGEHDVLSSVRQRFIGGVAVGLQDAREVLEQGDGVVGAAARRVGVDHGWRIGPATSSIVPGDGPEEARLGAAAARIQHWCAGLIDEQPAGGQQLLAHQGPDRLQLSSGVADPVGQGGAIDLDPLAIQALGLAIERGVIGVLGDQDLGHHPFGR